MRVATSISKKIHIFAPSEVTENETKQSCHICLICQFLQTPCDEAPQVTASIALPVSFVEAVNPAGEAVSVFLRVVDNLTDVCYQDHLSRLKYADLDVVTGRRGVFNMGRNFVLKLAVPIG